MTDRRILRQIRNYRFTLLLVVMVVYILIAPAIASIQPEERPNLGRAILLASFTAMLLTAIYSVRGGRVVRWTVVALAVPGVVIAWTEFATGRAVVTLHGLLLDLALVGLVCVVLLVYVFRQRKITLDVINASLCAYLFLGLAWAAGYGIIEYLSPGSFRVIDDGYGGFLAQTNDASVRRVYFSFVTLVTLGYGDIVPVGSVARLSAVMESFAGQMIMVVLVARLVGVHVSQQMTAPASEPDGGKETGR